MAGQMQSKGARNDSSNTITILPAREAGIILPDQELFRQAKICKDSEESGLKAPKNHLGSEIQKASPGVFKGAQSCVPATLVLPNGNKELVIGCGKIPPGRGANSDGPERLDKVFTTADSPVTITKDQFNELMGRGFLDLSKQK